MNRWNTFTFRVNREERQAIASLATQLQRSQSDAVRFVVIEAARQVSELHTKPVSIITIQPEQSKQEEINVPHE